MNLTYYTISGRDPIMLDSHLNNVKNYGGADKVNVDILIIIFKNPRINPNTTENIISVCKKQDARYVIFNEEEDNFLFNLYHCWNLGYENTKYDWVFRGGSDQVFNKNAFVELSEQIDECVNNFGDKVVLQANTIENSLRSPDSRHFIKNFGDGFDSLKLDEFENFCTEIKSLSNKKLMTIEECLDCWGKPTSLHGLNGNVNRTDGCSWAFHVDAYKLCGPLPPIERGVTGDVVIHDRLQNAGYQNFLIKDCITYHFVRGEREVRS